MSYKTYSEFLMEQNSKINHPFCEFVTQCNLKESTVYGEISICKEFVENFKKLSFELNSLLKYNVYPRKYVLGVPDDATSKVAIEFVNDYLRLIRSIIVFKHTTESYTDNDWLSPTEEADIKCYNVYIDMVNLSIKQFSKIINSNGKDCIKMNVLNKDVELIFKGEYHIEPINVDHLLTSSEILQPKSIV